MKNSLGEKAVARIASIVSASYPSFQQAEFEKQVNKGLNELELKARVNHIIAHLHQFLPADFTETAAILVKCKSHYVEGDSEDGYHVFAAWPLIDYVAEYGLDHPELSLETLKILTSLFSAEFAIRPFIIRYPDICLRFFNEWINDSDEHVRRLVSEGTRPRLPWGMQLKQYISDPTPCLPLLDALKTDNSLYVRRSVANHLNDIGKDHADLVLDTCLAWQKEKPKNEELAWVIRHATRSLIKAGHPKSFPLLGFSDNPQISLSAFNISADEITIGNEIFFNFTLKNKAQKTQRFVVDYALNFVKANGKQSAKVFKLKNCQLQANEMVELSKKHSFKLISTRKYYPGQHSIDVLINGKAVGQISFMLT